MIQKNKILLLILICLSFKGFSQTLPVGLLDDIEDAYRRQQLLGNDTSKSSFMIRPLIISDRNSHLLDVGNGYSLEQFRKKLYMSPNGKSIVYALPIAVEQQYNSHHPYGMNDGSMVSAKGYQTQISAGIFAKIGFLSLQLRPELVYAQNSDFRELHEAENGDVFLKAYANKLYNFIDLPERMTNGSYSKLDWGQSNVRLNFDPVSLGLSNENLWWGPGIRSSLLMSNNASGFKHITLNTTRPIDTYIGSFEAQIIGGRLENSNAPVPVNSALFKEKRSGYRYINAIALTYQPKWVPNLFFGLDRSFVVYYSDMGHKFGDYFPIFDPIEKRAFGELTTGHVAGADDIKARDQYISVYARWVMPESKAEIYFQYGRNDHAYDTRDLLVEPEHSRAYIAGFRKLIPLAKDNEYIQTSVEFTQIEGSRTVAIRDQPTWYKYGFKGAGYTNAGQVLGAGIGPGSNLQTLDVSWVKGLKKIGLQIERLVHNNDFYYGSSPIADIRSNWVDVSLAGKFDHTYKKFVINSQLGVIKSLNYQYALKEGKSFWDWDKQDAVNVHLKIGVGYLF